MIITSPMVQRAKKPRKTELQRLQAKAKREALENKFHFMWKALNGPELKRQHKFHETRKWTFDFAHVETRIAIEIEGGTWINGRHNRGQGYENDREKYNEANFEYWRVFCLTSKMITGDVVRRLIDVVNRDRVIVGMFNKPEAEK